MSEKKRKEKTVDFKDRILREVHDKDPKSRNYFKARSGIFAVVIGVLSLLAIWFFAVFIFDLYDIFKVYQVADKPIPFQVINKTLFELLVLASVFSFLIYIIYRQTDWALVKYKSLIAILILVATVVGGFGLFYTFKNKSDNNPLNKTIDGVERLPFREDRRRNIFKNLEEENVFMGRIASIAVEEGEIISLSIDNGQEKRVFLLNSKSELNRDDIVFDKPIVIKFYQKDGLFILEKAFKPKAPLQRMNPQMRRR